jgi:hypothetical protein
MARYNAPLFLVGELKHLLYCVPTGVAKVVLAQNRVVVSATG